MRIENTHQKKLENYDDSGYYNFGTCNIITTGIKDSAVDPTVLDLVAGIWPDVCQ